MFGVAKLRAELAELRAQLAASSQTALKARVDELEHELASLRASNRSEFGKLWYQQRSETPAGGRANVDVGDEAAFRGSWVNGQEH
jgi:ribosomal protein L29